MKALIYFIGGLIIGLVAGYFFSFQCPHEGYQLISQAQIDSLNQIATQPPIIKHDTIVITRNLIRTDTVWITNSDTSLQWHTDSLVTPEIDVSHSFLARDVKASTWAYRPIIRYVVDSIIITRPQIVEIEKLIVDKKLSLYITAGIGLQFTGAGIIATKERYIFGAMVDPWRGNIIASAGYRLTK